MKYIKTQSLAKLFGNSSLQASINLNFKKSLKDFKMEEDDSVCLSLIYKRLSPIRHLEIGTWRGFGAKLVLENSNATVWTVNPWEGEKRPDGSPSYSEPGTKVVFRKRWINILKRRSFENVTVQTDSDLQIGRLYREAGLGGRVNQIYATSKEWDTSNIPKPFFDSVLIDGSHEPDMVVHDTKKTLPLLRSGGLMIWHDYCPVPEVINSMSSVWGVTQGIGQLGEMFLEDNFSECFWIDPSWLLIGIKK